MSDLTEVWVVETGNYEQRAVWLVAVSLEAAVADIKRQFGAPYVVKWDDVEGGASSGASSYSLTGHFEQVPHFAIEHQVMFDIERFKLVT